MCELGKYHLASSISGPLRPARPGSAQLARPAQARLAGGDRGAAAPGPARYIIPLEQLSLLTNISQGGFGVVYKGASARGRAAAPFRSAEDRRSPAPAPQTPARPGPVRS